MASPDYLARRGTPLTPADLLAHDCLVYKGQLGAQKWYFRQQAGAPLETINVRGPLRSNNAEALLAAAFKGRGIVLFPAWLIGREAVESGQLCPLLPGWDASVMTEPAHIQLLSPQTRLRSRKIREVTRFLEQHLGGCLQRKR